MRDLSQVFEPVPVRTFEEAGWESKSFEAVAFALLAYQTLHGEPANVPAATGASHPVVLGAVTPAGTPKRDSFGQERRGAHVD
jgi:anhydro-N-acetylmuramic acid kinase